MEWRWYSARWQMRHSNVIGALVRIIGASNTFELAEFFPQLLRP